MITNTLTTANNSDSSFTVIHVSVTAVMIILIFLVVVGLGGWLWRKKSN